MGFVAGLVGMVNPVAGGALAVAGKAKAFAKSVPWYVWAILAGVALLWLGGCVHQKKVKAFGTERYAAGRKAADDDWKKALDKAHADAMTWKAKAEANAVKISQLLRQANEKDIHDNAVVTAGLLRGGSGAASCRPINHPVAAATPGGRQPAVTNTNAPGRAVPPEDWAAVPWPWVVTRAQEHDDCLSENKTWRDFYKQLPAALSPKLDVTH